MIALPSRSGRIAVLRAQDRDPLLERVVAALQGRGATAVAGGAVGADERVQPVQ